MWMELVFTEKEKFLAVLFINIYNPFFICNMLDLRV